MKFGFGREAYKRVTFEVCLVVAKVCEPASAVNENSRELLSRSDIVPASSLRACTPRTNTERHELFSLRFTRCEISIG